MAIRDSFGGKAEGLDWLVENQKLGYSVPSFEKLDFSFYLDSMKNKIFAPSDLLLNKSNYLVDKFKGKKVIVRSSSWKEDGKSSFAGIYESIILNVVTLDNVLSAIGSVYQSVNSQKAINYRTRHEIGEDKMGIVFQEYEDDADFSGVVFTSNPSYPDDLSIEFSKGSGGVVDNSGQTYIMDIFKKNGETVFYSENAFRIMLDEKFSRKLFNICRTIENKCGPSDIEFFAKGKKLFLVQKREITDIQKIEEVNIPEYSPDKLIGKTNIVRGTGKITLPAVVMQDISVRLDRPEMMMMPELAEMEVKNFFKDITQKNAKYSDGYIFITNQFGELVTGSMNFVLGTQKETTTDALTSNKKAVITTQHSSISSHIMTIARERGIIYAGFRDEEGLFSKIRTGDILSIYVKGREAQIYFEKRQKQSLRNMYEGEKITVTPGEKDPKNRPFSFDMSNLEEYEHITEDALEFLNDNTSKKWSFEPFGGTMGGYFTNDEGKTFEINIWRCGFQKYIWHMDREGRYPKKSISPNEFKEIATKYAEHLRN
ncbi:MAG: PEP/pyruvate-binding domain-containing protein [Candidatus Nanoarchaeia archaeon]